jgi:hypothetical protein
MTPEPLRREPTDVGLQEMDIVLSVGLDILLEITCLYQLKGRDKREAMIGPLFPDDKNRENRNVEF